MRPRLKPNSAQCQGGDVVSGHAAAAGRHFPSPHPNTGQLVGLVSGGLQAKRHYGHNDRNHLLLILSACVGGGVYYEYVPRDRHSKGNPSSQNHSKRGGLGIGTYFLGIGTYHLGIGTYHLGIGTYHLGIGT
eukprot:CAMPEP_0174326922 /NCGR_PEP_ID=MMETSP0810-20121108/14200_1 /TAXON_ID=73025 ORGANISM="Eutreptiella gymnastica-like, Strain CCMP1594" /NCGR_SAMPLE_ID=MMETSP0810 /ASSEMBLY_ACC=CAM_ASM_000659 /LENGTH=131 /DNA_ID=CAMNT_0015440651 /DNA_START=1928 /DNA_END=2320 /DNA_ORIENTATION=-